MVLGSSPHTRPRSRLAALAAAAVLVIGPSVSACGDDGGGGSETPPPTPSKDATSSAPAEPTTAPPSETAGGAQPDDPAAAEQEIKQNFEKFFDPEVPLADKEKVLENGAEMRPVLQAFSGDERGGQVSADVKKVEFTSPKDAKVTYDLALDGVTVLPDSAGTAVEQDGTWKVSVKTLCGLLSLSGNTSPMPGC
ncbi:hypothetical protein [Streptomyces sp. KLOTTS4A1]|uniref:hypothetical protein n=1 Tax=Streptomyces sp. KLOTTS4A1 TaxID=3390996 RepID=UPI0039F51F1D